MAKAIALTQTSYNGIETTEAPIALSTSKIYSLESNGSGTRVFYKNQDGSVLNTIDVVESASSILSNMNASSGTGVTMITLYDTNFNLVLIPASSFLMASELNDGGSIVTYSNNSSISNARVNNSVAGLVNIINGVTAGQYDSGQISIDTTTATTNQYVSAFDNTYKNNAVGYYTTNVVYDGLNQPNIIWNPNPPTNPSAPGYGFANEVYFKPSVPWTSISKVTIYTNITATATAPFGFFLGSATAQLYYNVGTTNLIYTGYTGAGALGSPNFGAVNQVLPGVAPTIPYTPNAGDAGTYWGQLTYSACGSVGDVFQGTGTYNIPTPTLADYWESSMIAFTWQSRNSTPNLKFRFVIDYI